jgi:hypothetical protein
MILLPFGNLPPYVPRRFVPEKIDLGDWAQIAPLFDQLEARAGACRTVAELEQWLLHCSELSAALDENPPPLHRDDVSHGRSRGQAGLSRVCRAR